MKKLLWSLMLFFPLVICAQGIQWTEGLSWEQIKQKARQENKYIFLDCYATWCGPCKKMDRNVYVNDSVGKYYNQNFISVKVQMDRTPKDNDFTKSWFRVGDSIKKWYIEVYPSYLFLSSQGTIVYIDKGYKSVGDFIAVGQIATKPGQEFNNPIIEYVRLVDEYKLGIKHWDRMPFMIAIAYKSGQKDLKEQLFREYMDYVTGLPFKQRYTKENIQLLAEVIPGIAGSNTERFRFFYDQGKIIDKVMHQKGYAAKVVDKTIEVEVLFPFYNTQPGREIMVPGLVRLDGKTEYREADWKKLYQLLKERFNKPCAKRNVLNAKCNWYEKHNRNDLFFKYSLQKLAGTKINYLDKSTANQINKIGWSCFLAITDKKTLVKTLPLMGKLVEQYPTTSWFLDTYANLLYKAGRKEEAIAWEEKAMISTPEYSNVVEQMKNGQPTYVDQGAVWK